MLYLRKIFTQDLRDGKQIAFPKEPSNYFFNFNYQTPDSDRQINFKFVVKDTESIFYSENNHIVSTRLYAAGSESRIDGQLRQFFINVLGATVDDIILFKKVNDTNFEFEYISQTAAEYNLLKNLLSGKNHNVVVNENLASEEENIEESSEDLISSFSKWLNAKPKNNYFDNDYIKTVSFLTKLQEKYSEIYSEDIFDVDFDDLDNFIEKINTNIWDQSTDFWRYSEAASNHQPRAILNKDNYQAFLKEFKYKRNHNFQPKNTIYYGAPGTGKSYRVDQIIKDLDPKYFERVTFHPEYDNASFVGGYKPVSQKNEKGDEEIGYRFVPQAFSTIYSRAWQDPTQQYYLVIEEINRGNCAEIFGEIFQLLDRNSEYTVTPSRELREHLLKDFSDNREHEGIRKGLKLPYNLHILATMNTSDQSLFPMDSAFKRRWEWEYVPICYDPKTEEDRDNLSFGYEIELPDGTKYRWIDFISKINNNHIKNNPSLGMDKCIGNYFIKPDSGNFISLKPFISKVIFYLWNDVFKDEDNKVFESNGSYEDFFPIASAGVTKVKELFERIELSPISVYAERDEEYRLGQVAEENQTVEN